MQIASILPAEHVKFKLPLLDRQWLLQLRAWFLAKENRPLIIAVSFSLLIHLVIITLRFAYPDPSRALVAPNLDIILVNSHSSKPDEAQALAQFNSDGGGNSSDDRRAKSFLEASPFNQMGEEQQLTAKRVRVFDVRLRTMLTGQQTKATKVNPKSERDETTAPDNFVHGSDERTTQRLISKLEAELAQSVEEFNKMPKKKFLAPRTLSYPAALYLDEWSDKVERLGNLNYPAAAKGRYYGSIALYIELKPDGNLEKLQMLRSSGIPLLDEAALRFVRQSAPFGRIPSSALEGNDLLSFTRVIRFDFEGNTQVDGQTDADITATNAMTAAAASSSPALTSASTPAYPSSSSPSPSTSSNSSPSSTSSVPPSSTPSTN